MSFIDILKESLVYSSQSQTGLKWIVATRGGRGINAGDSAGSLTSSGYYRTRLNGIAYLNSRLVWMLFNGEIQDGFVIDHIDGDTKNNQIDNLRLVSTAINTRNRKTPSNNTSSVKGVSVSEHRSGNLSWVATFYKDGRKYSKSFPYTDVGFNQAVQWRLGELKEMDNGYTERHLQ